jgi:hypothetical protein
MLVEHNSEPVCLKGLDFISVRPMLVLIKLQGSQDVGVFKHRNPPRTNLTIHYIDASLVHLLGHVLPTFCIAWL